MVPVGLGQGVRLPVELDGHMGDDRAIPGEILGRNVFSAVGNHLAILARHLLATAGLDVQRLALVERKRDEVVAKPVPVVDEAGFDLGHALVESSLCPSFLPGERGQFALQCNGLLFVIETGARN